MLAIEPRRFIAAAAFFLLAGGGGHAQSLEVREGEILSLKLDGPANTIAVGNTAIVDARMAFADTVLLVGLTTGSTNIVAFGDTGEQIFSSPITVVSAVDQQTVIVIAGTRSRTVVCERSRCSQAAQPEQSMGQRDRFVSPTDGEVDQ